MFVNKRPSFWYYIVTMEESYWLLIQPYFPFWCAKHDVTIWLNYNLHKDNFIEGGKLPVFGGFQSQEGSNKESVSIVMTSKANTPLTGLTHFLLCLTTPGNRTLASYCGSHFHVFLFPRPSNRIISVYRHWHVGKSYSGRALVSHMKSLAILNGVIWRKIIRNHWIHETSWKLRLILEPASIHADDFHNSGN